MSKILIAGDSWACGEWPLPGETHKTGHESLRHRGIAHWLEQQGHEVTQQAEGGHSNFDQIKHLGENLDHHSFDLVVFVVTDPLRDEKHIRNTWAEHQAQIQEAWQGVWDRLGGFDHPIHLVGGCVAIPNTPPIPANCDILCRDWIELILGSRPMENLCRAWPYPDNPGATLLDHWHREEQHLEQWLIRCQISGTAEHQHFWPDGRHPNRQAHRLLAHLIHKHTI